MEDERNNTTQPSEEETPRKSRKPIFTFEDVEEVEVVEVERGKEREIDSREAKAAARKAEEKLRAEEKALAKERALAEEKAKAEEKTRAKKKAQKKVTPAAAAPKRKRKGKAEETGLKADDSMVPTEGYIRFENVQKIYRMGEVEINALAGVDFSINRGEVCIIVGPSGAGKSTILNILGGMDRLSLGNMYVAGENVSHFDEQRLIEYRRNDVGFVFQFYNLVPNLTALENVELATQIARDPFDAGEIIGDVGLAERAMNFPAQLSGGEQQRVAIARALAKNPRLMLCDEPTGALDYNTGKMILKLLQDTAINRGMTVVIVTHNLALADIGNRVIRIKNGVVDSITVNEKPMDVLEVEW